MLSEPGTDVTCFYELFPSYLERYLCFYVFEIRPVFQALTQKEPAFLDIPDLLEKVS